MQECRGEAADKVEAPILTGETLIPIHMEKAESAEAGAAVTLKVLPG